MSDERYSVEEIRILLEAGDVVDDMQMRLKNQLDIIHQYNEEITHVRILSSEVTSTQSLDEYKQACTYRLDVWSPDKDEIKYFRIKNRHTLTPTEQKQFISPQTSSITLKELCDIAKEKESRKKCVRCKSCLQTEGSAFCYACYNNTLIEAEVNLKKLPCARCATRTDRLSLAYNMCASCRTEILEEMEASCEE